MTNIRYAFSKLTYFLLFRIDLCIFASLIPIKDVSTEYIFTKDQETHNSNFPFLLLEDSIPVLRALSAAVHKKSARKSAAKKSFGRNLELDEKSAQFQVFSIISLSRTVSASHRQSSRGQLSYEKSPILREKGCSVHMSHRPA